MTIINKPLLLTWLDVERVIKKETNNFTILPDSISNIDCYSDGMDVEYKSDLDAAKDWICSILPSDVLADGDFIIKLVIGDSNYQVSFTQNDTVPHRKDNGYPIWREQVYSPAGNKNYPKSWERGPAVVAFHSFKGGVGRTTSLMTYAAAVLNSKGNEKVKILLIDADLEAPGISFWLDGENRPTVSFINFLEAIHYSPADRDTTLNHFVTELQRNSINVGGANKEIFVMPSALDLSEIMDMPITPIDIAKNIDNPWVLSDCIQNLGALLEVDIVFVDLRAGLSELSSPLLFDPRVEHFFVSTVAPQSVRGMAEILSRIHDSHIQLPPEMKTQAKPSVILSLLTSQLRQLQAYSLASELLNAAYPTNEEDMLTQGIEWVEAEFNESLMSIQSVRHALEQLPKSSLYLTASTWANSHMESDVKEISNQLPIIEERKIDAQKLSVTCDKFQFAENATTSDMLITDPLRNLAKHYTDNLPNTVSIGAKGAGKTFTYLQICRTKTWGKFVNKTIDNLNSSIDGFIYPWLRSGNVSDIYSQQTELTRTNTRDEIKVNTSHTQMTSFSLIKKALKDKDTDWDNFWCQLLIAELNPSCSDFNSLNTWLVDIDKSIVLLVDGVEDLFDSPEQDANQREAIKALLELPNYFSEIRNRRIGFICFIRADYIQAVIKQNTAQYVARFQPFKLEWTPESFLRLAYWICGKAEVIGANSDSAETLSTEELLKYLEKLWGQKLGRNSSKEANTARWVFAALCDLNGRLQARDLVRFLKFSAKLMYSGQTANNRNESWGDRILAPEAIRRSLPECSTEKVNEAIAEIKALSDWQKILTKIPAENLKVPFNPSTVGLSIELLTSLKELGIIYEDVDQLGEENRFYLPEIYRWGLKFGSVGGGRPRVQALLKRNLGGMPF